MHGVMRISVEVLNTVIPKFLRDGWQVVSFILDIFKQASNPTEINPFLNLCFPEIDGAFFA
jgi:hypothetical protein